jgi:HAD superfamily hydrolase (TIGR01509 family)
MSSLKPVVQEKLQELMRITEGPYKAFLYDCDGTLADNMHAHKAAFVKTAAEYGFEMDPAIIDELAGWPTLKVAEEIMRRYDVSFDIPAFSKRKSEVFVEDFIQQTEPIQFVVEHLKHHVGKKKIGVVSGGSRSTVTITLDVIGVDAYLDTLVCAGETERGKPYPDPFLKAARELGVEPHECFVFEDGEPGCQAAEAAGMKWVRIDQI